MGWPVWSADGTRIFYGSERSGPWQIWSRAADGSDEERPISKADISVTPTAVSPDAHETGGGGGGGPFRISHTSAPIRSAATTTIATTCSVINDYREKLPRWLNTRY
jgi:hypothetical protein